MTPHRFHLAIVVVTGLFVSAALEVGTVASAADCEIPTFLGTGKTYNFNLPGAMLSVMVVEIDRQSCWIKGQWKQPSEQSGARSGTSWFNLRLVLAIEEVQAMPPPAKPGQRR